MRENYRILVIFLLFLGTMSIFFYYPRNGDKTEVEVNDILAGDGGGVVRKDKDKDKDKDKIGMLKVGPEDNVSPESLSFHNELKKDIEKSHIKLDGKLQFISRNRDGSIIYKQGNVKVTLLPNGDILYLPEVL